MKSTFTYEEKDCKQQIHGNRPSPVHLWQYPAYRDPRGVWHSEFSGAIKSSKGRMRWNPGGILSSIAFSYPCGDITLVEGIRRSPWLSGIDQEDEVELSSIPPHGRTWMKPRDIAARLLELLEEEARAACRSHSEIYILLSGGLDSRIVAGVVSRLKREGKIEGDLYAATWGLEDSRDVVYAREIAGMLGLEWCHIPIGPETIMDNIDLSASTGNMLPPSDLHCLSWFSRVPPGSLVLAGSYGDSIGRGEYSGQHILELEPLMPRNLLELLKPPPFNRGAEIIQGELDNLMERCEDKTPYVLYEHQQQGHYMRSMIAQAISVLLPRCDVYQMFTAPPVYSFMWSIHPSIRDNRTYAHLLELIHPHLARLPWARTNRALRGRTERARRDVRKQFHCYAEWISGPLYHRIKEIVDPGWFEQTGIFRGHSIEKLTRSLKPDQQSLMGESFKPYRLWLWLAGIRKFHQWCGEYGVNLEYDPDSPENRHLPPYHPPRDNRTSLRKFIARWRTARTIKRKLKRIILKWRAIRDYPPEPGR